VRLTSSFVFKDLRIHLSLEHRTPLKETSAMAVMATIVISSSNKIEDVRMNFCDYNGITKIAEVANTNSDLFVSQLSFQRLPIATSRESNGIE